MLALAVLEVPADAWVLVLGEDTHGSTLLPEVVRRVLVQQRRDCLLLELHWELQEHLDTFVASDKPFLEVVGPHTTMRTEWIELRHGLVDEARARGIDLWAVDHVPPEFVEDWRTLPLGSEARERWFQDEGIDRRDVAMASHTSLLLRSSRCERPLLYVGAAHVRGIGEVLAIEGVDVDSVIVTDDRTRGGVELYDFTATRYSWDELRFY